MKSTFYLSRDAELTLLPDGRVEVADYDTGRAVLARLAADAQEASDRLNGHGQIDDAAREELRRQAFAEALAAMDR